MGHPDDMPERGLLPGNPGRAPGDPQQRPDRQVPHCGGAHETKTVERRNHVIGKVVRLDETNDGRKTHFIWIRCTRQPDMRSRLTGCVAVMGVAVMGETVMFDQPIVGLDRGR